MIFTCSPIGSFTRAGFSKGNVYNVRPGTETHCSLLPPGEGERGERGGGSMKRGTGRAAHTSRGHANKGPRWGTALPLGVGGRLQYEMPRCVRFGSENVPITKNALPQKTYPY